MLRKASSRKKSTYLPVIRLPLRHLPPPPPRLLFPVCVCPAYRERERERERERRVCLDGLTYV